MLYIHSASKQSFRKVLAFVGSCRPHWQFLSCEKKGTKDSQGTSWFLDLQQKGALPPLDTPSGESSFARFSGAMTTKVISAETKTLPCPLSTPPVGLETLVVNEGERDRFAVTAGETSPLRRYQRGHFLFDTLLDTFLVKEKYPQEWAA